MLGTNGQKRKPGRIEYGYIGYYDRLIIWNLLVYIQDGLINNEDFLEEELDKLEVYENAPF